MTNELGDTMMERDFQSLDSEGNSGTIKLRIGKPYFDPEASTSLTWRCPYQIIGIGSEKIKAAPGFDAINALQVCLQMAEAYLESYRHMEITWQDEDDLGLHLPHFELPDQDESQLETEDSPFQKAFDAFFLNLGKPSNGQS
jgi:hypothetical protein